LESDILRKLRERTIKNFIDILILAELKKGRALSGYDFIAFVHKKFYTLIGSGTVYSILYSLERDGLIRGIQASKKRVYKLTDKGEETIDMILNAKENIRSLMTTLL